MEDTNALRLLIPKSQNVTPHRVQSIASGIPGVLENAQQHVERESDKTLEQNCLLSSLVDLAKDMLTILSHAIMANALLQLTQNAILRPGHLTAKHAALMTLTSLVA